jgi:hypothetical protein
LLCDRRRRRAIAFWISLFWVAFGFWGLDCLLVESEKGSRRVGLGWQGLEREIFFFSLFSAKRCVFLGGLQKSNQV